MLLLYKIFLINLSHLLQLGHISMADVRAPQAAVASSLCFKPWAQVTVESTSSTGAWDPDAHFCLEPAVALWSDRTVLFLLLFLPWTQGSHLP